MKRRIEIFVETERLLFLRNRPAKGTLEQSMWCNACSAEVSPLTTDEAALRTHVTSLSIFRRVEAGLIHYGESSDGLLLICPNSLAVN